MKIEIKEYNKRQINLIYNKINDYVQGKISIRWLIDDIEALIYCIQNPPENFVNQSISEWSELEIVYANALYENRNYFNSQETVRINNALAQLQHLMETYEKEYLFDLE